MVEAAPDVIELGLNDAEIPGSLLRYESAIVPASPMADVVTVTGGSGYPCVVLRVLELAEIVKSR